MRGLFAILPIIFLLFSCDHAERWATEVDRWDRTEFITVDCGKYGERQVWFNPENSQYVADDFLANWGEYWPNIRKAYEKMLKKEGKPEWGNYKMLKGSWEFRVFDSFTEEDPMPEGRVILNLVFLVDGEELVPVWDAFLDYGEVTHSQPVW